MTENEDDNWRFDLDEVGPDSDEVGLDPLDEDGETDNSGGSVHDMPGGKGTATAMALLPFWTVGIYAVIEYNALVSALASLFGGATVLAEVVASAFLVVGGVMAVVAGIAVLAIALLVFVGLWKRDVVRLVSAVILGLIAAGMYFGAGFFFPALPLVVGMYLTLVGGAYIAAALLGALVILGALVVL